MSTYLVIDGPRYPDTCEHGKETYAATLQIETARDHIGAYRHIVVDVYVIASPRWGDTKLCIRYGDREKYLSYELDQFLWRQGVKTEQKLPCGESTSPINYAVFRFLFECGNLSWKASKVLA